MGAAAAPVPSEVIRPLKRAEYLVAGVLERHQEPGPQGYARVTQHGRAQELTMVRFADVVVRVTEVLPAA